MEMDDRDSVKCQKSKRRDTGNFGKFLMRMGQKINSVHLPQFEDQNDSGWMGSAESELRFEILIFRERGSDFSLRSLAIGPSDFFGPRRKVALRGEDYA